MRTAAPMLASLSLFVAGLAACGFPAPWDGDTPTIEGTTWRAVTVDGMVPVEGREPTLNLGPGNVSGWTGCNSYESDGLQLDGRSIHVIGLSMTAVSCAGGNIMAVEGAYFEALSQAQNLQVENGRLLVSGGGGEIVFGQIGGR